jgi:murein DD-endopeptidase MepM/ murein hydrolase activator NlpD
MTSKATRIGGLGGGRIALACGLLAGAVALSGCQNRQAPLDWDLRRAESFSTAEAALAASGRPQAERTAVARRGETVAAMAQRVGVDAVALAQQNALNTDTRLRGGETLVLPGAPGMAAAPMMPSEIAVTPLGGETGGDAVRHQVQRGETAFTIARLYNVSSRALAERNNLGPDMEVREGQVLVIPTATADAPAERTAALTPSPLPAPTPAPTPAPQPTTSAPGQGTPTPVPPSAAEPLPTSRPEPAGQATAAATPPAPPVADMQAERTERPRLAMPVEGRIIRAYSRGRNDGIGIGAPAGTAVRAAAAGTVAAITRDTDQVPIMVVRHANNLLTVYANIDDIRVERGASVRAGQTLATVRSGDPSFLHFEVREGFESVDPMPFLQ